MNDVSIPSILPRQVQIDHNKLITPEMSEILPNEMHQVTDLEAMEEGAVTRAPTQHTRGDLSQIQHMPIVK